MTAENYLALGVTEIENGMGSVIVHCAQAKPMPTITPLEIGLVDRLNMLQIVVEDMMADLGKWSDEGSDEAATAVAFYRRVLSEIGVDA